MRWIFLHMPQENDLSAKLISIICAALFLIALGVRLLYWQDNKFAFAGWGTIDPYSASVIGSGMPAHYRDDARLLLNGDIQTFLQGPVPPNDAQIIMHPPGYPIVTALAFKAFDDSDASMRLVHLIGTSAAAALVFLITIKLLPVGIGIIGGLLVALSPQLAFYSLMLRPDALVPVPLLLSMYFIIRAVKRFSAGNMILAGVFLGMACWLRSDTLLIAPFLTLAIQPLLKRGQRWRQSLLLLCGTAAVIMPITIRNLLVFRNFIPLSLGAGVTLIQGIADYDNEKRFNLPTSDFQTVQQEVNLYNRPDYAKDLFNPDGISREKARVERGLAVIRSHPLWFAGVIFQRAVSMLRYERVPLVSASPSVTDVPAPNHGMQPTRLISLELGTLKHTGSLKSEPVLIDSRKLTRIVGDNLTKSQHMTFPEISIQRNTEYMLCTPIKVEHGSATIYINDVNTGERLASTTTLIPLMDIASDKQPVGLVTIPFVSGQTDRINVVVVVGGKTDSRVLQVGQMELFVLGPASTKRTYLVRVPIRIAQKFFLTAWKLPLMIVGVSLLAIWRRKAALTVLCSIPIYYLFSHALFHTEFRMVLSLHYFYCILSAVTIYTSVLLGVSVLKQFHRSEF